MTGTTIHKFCSQFTSLIRRTKLTLYICYRIDIEITAFCSKIHQFFNYVNKLYLISEQLIAEIFKSKLNQIILNISEKVKHHNSIPLLIPNQTTYANHLLQKNIPHNLPQPLHLLLRIVLASCTSDRGASIHHRQQIRESS